MPLCECIIDCILHKISYWQNINIFSGSIKRKIHRYYFMQSFFNAYSFRIYWHVGIPVMRGAATLLSSREKNYQSRGACSKICEEAGRTRKAFSWKAANSRRRRREDRGSFGFLSEHNFQRHWLFRWWANHHK